MKKKLVIALAATLILGQVPSGRMVFANSDKNTAIVDLEDKIENKTYENKIFVKGLDVQGHKYHGAYIRFDINDSQNKKLIVTDMNGSAYKIQRHFGNNTYFAITLYDAYGNVKKNVELKGNDPLSKLNDINNTKFEYGDYLKIIHKESTNRLSIEGKVIDNYDYPNIPEWVLKQNHYEITEAGLRLVYETGETSESKESYWNKKDQFSLNVKFAKNKEEFDNDIKSVLLIKNEKGQIVKEVGGYLTNRYSDDPSNFNGSQFNLTQEILKELQKGKYFLSLQLKKNGVQYVNVEIKQNELTGSTSKYSDINKTESKVIGDKEYKFKTENSKTGRIVLEVIDNNIEN